MLPHKPLSVPDQSRFFTMVDSLIREYGSFDDIVWTTMDGEKITLGNMTDSHVFNCIEYHRRMQIMNTDIYNSLVEDLENVKKQNVRSIPLTDRENEIADYAETIENCKFLVFLMERVAKRRQEKSNLTSRITLGSMRHNIASKRVAHRKVG